MFVTFLYKVNSFLVYIIVCSIVLFTFTMNVNVSKNGNAEFSSFNVTKT